MIERYQKASGARINLEKSKVMALVGWETTTDVMGIQYKDEVKIFGITFHRKTEQTIAHNWAIRMRIIKTQARELYSRNLGLHHRIQYVHGYLLARAWYFAQIMPMNVNTVRQINTTINWFIWNGKIFKVPLRTLQRPKKDGGWDLVNNDAKSKALHYRRMKLQGQMKGTFMAEWQRHWCTNKKSQNSPNNHPDPRTLFYLRVVYMASAYVDEKGKEEMTRSYKNRLYNAMALLNGPAHGPSDMRIKKYWPHHDWQAIWDNLHTAPVPGNMKGEWFKMIHDLTPTNTRLHTIRLSPMDKCTLCPETDTLLHWITESVEGKESWEWASGKMAMIIRIAPK
jgi:hypothetical protein